ncbi:chain length determinant protein EpsF [Caldimonas brevitalea]|uniref:Chain-length determining protein n=1 Tax=Caldimonas brevitalea TaxID=413882 RepID=A0A0G3BIT2_9BURK|nr:chain length determinant protein EpsF [Caldimonas brevitalea]AKJ27908.1 chain-length determining protein [Caldimonas brevitalea]
MSLGQFFSILLARWKVALAVFLVVVGGATGAVFMLDKEYTATATVLVDVRSPDPVAGMILPGTPNYLLTQLEIVRSERVAQRVVRNLRLAENPQTVEQWREATGGTGSSVESWLAKALLRKLEVKPSGDSNVLSVNYQSVDPKFSALLTNAFVQAYIDTNLDLRVEPAKQYSSFFDTRAKELRAQLEGAQARLSAYQKEHGLVATDERLDIESARLQELSSQLVAIQALAADTSSRQNQAKTSASETPDVLQNPLIASLKGDLDRQEVKLQELSARYGNSHPQVIEAQASINALRGRIEGETRRVTGGVSVSNNINRLREAEVRAALDAQRELLLKMRERRDEAMVLVKDVENAQRAYDAVLARLNQTSLESHTNTTNASVLSPAVEPAAPSSPKVMLIMMMALAVGSVLAVAASFLLELLDRRARSYEDVVQLLGLPVLGVMPKPLRRKLLFRGSGGNAMIPRRVLGQLPRPKGA